MLNFALKGTYQDPSGYSWDYYRDDQLDPNPDPNAFYIIPKPQFVFDNLGKPSFQVVRHATDNKATNLAGYCRFDIELAVPAEIQGAVAQAILANPTKFPGVTKPNFPTLALNRGGKAYFDFAAGGSNIAFAAPVSNYAGNVASFLLQMTKEQLDTLIAAFTASGGAYNVEYHLSVPARLQGVSAVLSFDSSIAYSYQVTQPSYDGWGDETSPGSVQSMLKESASSKVDITWGLADPPADLKQDVANWANGTLADLVSAEVQKVIQLQGLQSGESFNISECSSFTSTYTENMVINWLISPTATLPTFKDLGLDIADFTQTVNEQQMHMGVTVFLPFKSDSSGAKNVLAPRMPDGKTAQALVDHVDVSVTYPGLSQANGTATLSANGTKVFTTPYDSTAGPSWSLSYAVTYVDPTMGVVTGSVAGITKATYTLEVEAAGILTVVFDATQAFQSQAVKPTEIDVDFSFINRDGAGHPINQSVKIPAPTSTANGVLTAEAGKGSITSMVGKPISTPYNYRVTYFFPGGVQFRGPLVQGVTGSTVIIAAADAVHPTNLIVFSKPDSDNPVLEVSVSMYYAAPPSIATISGVAGTFPTKESPAVFTIEPPASGNLLAKKTFYGFINGDQPLIYSATISAANGEVDVDDQPIDNGQTAITISPDVSYFTLQINPEPIDWTKADQVEVLIQMHKGTSMLGRQKSFIWNKGDSTKDMKYYTQPAGPDDTVTYDWHVNYLNPAHKTETVTGLAASDVVFNVPATSTSASAAAH